ncbi:MAG: caspase family protein [Hyphomicrobiaceae bacterium]|nr:caspase family protein [Hyphomicrobiaceae bacterium]
MSTRIGCYFLVVVAALVLARPAIAQTGGIASWERPRVALIVGASEYRHLQKLPNPVRDAELIAATAQDLGFQVSLVIDPSRKELFKAISELRSAIVYTNAVVVFYFAGHAVQVSGRNLMMPIEAKVATDGVDLDEVYQALGSREPHEVNIVILDACRDDPLGGTTSGLAKPQVTLPGTYIAYSAAPGQVAADGEGTNSPFAAALANAMRIPGLTIEEALKDVRTDVGRQTNGQQSPWDTSSLNVKFHFVPRRSIFADSSQRLLTDAELATLDCPSLWIARNEIFKRHGYCFATPRGQDYFGNAGCTTPDQDVVKRQAASTPVDNIERISLEESRRGCRGGKPAVAGP